MTEHDEQKTLMKWWNVYCATRGIDSRLLFAIPNAAKRTVKVASMMKAEGMRTGVPDLFLASPSGKSHGMFIEMKREKGGVVRAEQKSYISVLQSAGYCAVVCCGFEAARDCIIAYLNSEVAP